MESSVLQTHILYESITSTYLADELMNAVNEWKLARPNIAIPVTTDNVQNIVNAIKILIVLGATDVLPTF